MLTNPRERKMAPPMTFAVWLRSDVETPSENSSAPTMRKSDAKKGTMVSRIVGPVWGKRSPTALIVFGSVTHGNLRGHFSQNRRRVRFFHFSAAAASGIRASLDCALDYPHLTPAATVLTPENLMFGHYHEYLTRSTEYWQIRPFACFKS